MFKISILVFMVLYLNAFGAVVQQSAEVTTKPGTVTGELIDASIEDLNDVDAMTPNTDEVLTWDGDSWTNQAVPASDNYWTATGDSIANNNAGSVEIQNTAEITGLSFTQQSIEDPTMGTILQRNGTSSRYSKITVSGDMGLQLESMDDTSSTSYGNFGGGSAVIQAWDSGSAHVTTIQAEPLRITLSGTTEITDKNMTNRGRIYLDESGNLMFSDEVKSPISLTDLSSGGSSIWEKSGTVIRTTGEVVQSTDDFVFGSPQLSDTGNANNDSRFFFDKSEGTFRAGSVDSTQWDAASTGNYSAAFGYNTTGSGDYSFCAGDRNTSSGGQTVVIGGYLNTAAAQYSAIIGGTSNATTAGASYSAVVGGYSHSIGSSATHGIAAGGDDNTVSASCAGTFAGNLNTASGNYSIALGGSGNTASGIRSTVFGQNMTVSGDLSVGINLNATTRTLSQAATFAIMGGKVGIDNLTPSVQLDITGKIRFSQSQEIVDANTYITKDGSNNMVLRDAVAGAKTLYQLANPTVDILPNQYFNTPESDGIFAGRTRIAENQLRLLNFGLSWSEMTGSGSRNFWSMACSSDGRYQNTTVYSGNIYTSADYGATWTSRDSSRTWRDSAISADGKYQTAVVGSGYVYTSSDYGVTWTQRDSSRNWWAVMLSASGQYQIATAGGIVYGSSDYGVTWAQKGSHTAQLWAAISSDGKYQTTAGNAGNIYTSSDYGATWTSRDSSRRWAGVAMSSDGRVQSAAVGTSGFTGNIYVSTNYGVTWTSKASSQEWMKIVMSSDGQYQAAYTGDITTGYIYGSSDYGSTWTQLTGAGNRTFAGLAITSDGKMILASTIGGYIYSSNTDTGIAGSLYPSLDNTFYLGRNDDDSPQAYKGLILKDTTNGKYYRIEVISGTITATDLTD